MVSFMEASAPPNLPNPRPQPNLEATKQKLLKHGIQPTPKTPKIQPEARQRSLEAAPTPYGCAKTGDCRRNNFQIIKYEHKKFAKSMKENNKIMGMPWEVLEKLRLRELANQNLECGGDKLKPERFRELSDIIECERDKFSWLLDDDVEIEDGLFEKNGRGWVPRKRSDAE